MAEDVADNPVPLPRAERAPEADTEGSRLDAVRALARDRLEAERARARAERERVRAEAEARAAAVHTPKRHPEDPWHRPDREPTAADDEREALRAELGRERAGREAERLAHSAAVASLRDEAEARCTGLEREVSALRTQLERLARSSPSPEAGPAALPILCHDLARWSRSTPAEPVAVAVAVPVGPPPQPPSLDDLGAAAALARSLQGLLRTPVAVGTPFHSLFDPTRLHALEAELREVVLLADRLLKQVDRSRTNKELLWHLMVARRNDEVRRQRR
jgi:hypothetical protein